MSRTLMQIGLLVITLGAAAWGGDSSPIGTTLSPGSEKAREAPNDDGKAKESFQSALVGVAARDWELARRQMQEAVRIWVQLRAPERAARALLQLGHAYRREQNYPECLYCYKQVLLLKSVSGAATAEANIAIARAYVELSNDNLARTYLDRGVQQAKLAGENSALVLALSLKAAIHRRNGDRRGALAAIAEARRLEGQDENSNADLLQTTAQILKEDGKSAFARAAFEKALAIHKNSGEVEGQVLSLCSLSDLSLMSSQGQKALAQAMEAVQLADQLAKTKNDAQRRRAQDLQWRACLARARAERATGQLSLASKSFKWAVIHAEASWLVFKRLTENGGLAFRQDTQALYREFIDLLFEQGQIVDAFGFAEMNKARIVSGMAAVRSKRISAGQRVQQPHLDGLRSIARLRTKLLSAETDIERNKIENEIRDAEAALDEARLKSELEKPRDQQIWSDQATVKSLQPILSRNKTRTAVVEFLLGESRSFVWLITADGLWCEVLPGRAKLETAVRLHLASLTNPPNPALIDPAIAKTRAQAESLFSTLFGSLSRQIAPGQKLIIVPDGPLHYLPFETLIRNRRFLVEDHEISYTPSASLLGLWKAVAAQENKKMELLAFGDPVFDPKPSAFKGKNSVSGDSMLALRTRLARSYSMPPLPRTRDEVVYAGDLFPEDRRRIYLGKDSTEDALKRESLRDFKRLHFATHSLIDELSPSRSAIMLTLDTDPQEDGMLDLTEISHLDLDCDLVVLSACQTGRGKLFSGEGIVGISRSFITAGARAVAVSLWNVSDITTSRFMKRFYEHLAKGADNAAALRAAKLQIMEDARALKHPHYWAPFILIGKP